MKNHVTHRVCFIAGYIFSWIRTILLLIFIFIAAISVHSQNKANPISAELNSAIEHKQQYVQQKEAQIAALKKMKETDISLLHDYQLNNSLYDEYRKFKLDSSIYYVTKNLQIAHVLKRIDLVVATQVQLANLYSTIGKYRESETLLKNIDRKQLPKQLLSAYYDAYSQFFEHYTVNINSDIYIKQIENYRDSLLSVLDPSSMKYKINLAQRDIYRGELDVPEKVLLALFKTTEEKNPDYAMIAFLLGDIYKSRKNNELEQKYYSISAISDLKNAIKDNAAIQSLALIFYQTGDVDNAYKCTKSAVEDAIFCNVKFRTLQMSELYSIITTSYQEKEAKRKGLLQLYLVLISVLSVFLILAVLYVYKQMKKVSKIKGELSLSNNKLLELNTDICKTNDQLQEMNMQLSDSNRIKEEYIAHFFDMCSSYINKMEDYRKTLNKKALNMQHDELFKMLKSTTLVENEIEELYRNFDSIFLNLYPTFISEYNSLLQREEQVVLKQGEILNTELRIFALIRLGITDSVKIAAFLRYSLSTIYNYRTKVRHKAVVSRDQFEELVMKIGTVPKKTK